MIPVQDIVFSVFLGILYGSTIGMGAAMWIYMRKPENWQ